MVNLIILDASTSMSPKVPEVQGGIKQLFKQIKDDYKAAKKKIKPLTMVTDFSGPRDFKVLVNSKVLSELKDEVADNYAVRGMTALYDAIGQAFLLVPEKETEVFVNILTDGEENSSQEFNSKKIQDLIAEKKKKGWAITFMGTTEAAINNAVSIGISRGNTFAFSDSKDGVTNTLNKMNSVRSMYYNASVDYAVQKSGWAKGAGAGEASCDFMSLDTDNLMAEDEKLNKKKKDDKS